jgi:hypothetical protein
MMLVVFFGDLDYSHGVDDGESPKGLQHVIEQLQILQQRFRVLRS